MKKKRIPINELEPPPKCACGCGGEVTVSKHCKFKWNKFIFGHNVNILNRNNPAHLLKGEMHPLWKGGRNLDKDGYVLVKCELHPFTTKAGYVYEHRLVMEEYLRKVNPTHKCLVKIDDELFIKKGYVIKHNDKNPANNDISNLRVVLHSKHMSEENKGVTRIFTQEHIDNIRKSRPDIHGENNPMFGRHHSEETKEKIREIHIGLPGLTGKANPMWQGGVSFEPYSPEFNEKLKSKVRKRNNFTCQECCKTEKELGYTLHCHHIDYNKKNNIESNLICLCQACHAQTNWKRDDWTKYFMEKNK